MSGDWCKVDSMSRSECDGASEVEVCFCAWQVEVVDILVDLCFELRSSVLFISLTQTYRV